MSDLSYEQNQTADTFGYKWAKRSTYESDAMQKFCAGWIRGRYDFGTPIEEAIRGKKVLDAGCGAGHAALLLFGNALKECQYVGVDISDAVDVAQRRFEELGLPGRFVRTSLTELPSSLGNFDVILSEGVLHHTDSTRDSMKTLAQRLFPGGYFMFYVYRKKGPIREFTDDLIRAKLQGLSNDEAWRALESLTRLGKILGDLQVEIEIPEAIDLLEIPAGKISLQRLFYWHVCKMFYRPELSLEEMNHIQFDWFRPLNCHRHSEQEVRQWLQEAGLVVVKFQTEEAGMTVVAQRPVRSET